MLVSQLTSSCIFIVANKVRRLFGLNKIIHLIADTHAKDHFPDREVDVVALRDRTIVQNLVDRLGLSDHYTIIFSSEIDTSEVYLNTLEKVRSLCADGDYFAREATDIHHLHETHNVVLKLSWAMPGKKKAKRDESRFDAIYESIFGADRMSFIYTTAGMTFDPRRRNVCPYVSVLGELRLLFQEGACGAKIEEWRELSSGAYKHVARLVAGFEIIFLTIVDRGLTLTDKVDSIISLSCLH